MGRSWIGTVWVVAALYGPFAAGAAAHPASGIVVNAKGEVFFVHTGVGVGMIDADGKLTYVHKVKGGGHYLVADPTGKFATQLPRLFERITPEGAKPALLYASGGGPFVVHPDGNLYYASGFPDGDDQAPGGLTLTRLSPDGKRTLFAPDLKKELARLKEAVTGLAVGPDGSLLVACPNAILKVRTDGTVATFARPIEVKDGSDAFGEFPDSPFFHAPYLRGLDVTEGGTVYAAVTGRRCVVTVSEGGKVETVLAADKPWTPTGVAVRGKEVFVLEYTHDGKPEDWVPRVRKRAADGKVTILADLSGDGRKRER